MSSSRPSIDLPCVPCRLRRGSARAVLVRAHAAGGPATDDASMAERLGIAVTVVEGAEESFKITTPWDLRIAEALA